MARSYKISTDVDRERYLKDEDVEWLPLPSREQLVAEFLDDECRVPRLLFDAIDVGFEYRWIQRFVHSRSRGHEHGWYHLAVRSGCTKSFGEAFGKNLDVVVLPYWKLCTVSCLPEERRDREWVEHRHVIVVVKDDKDGEKCREALDRLQMSEEEEEEEPVPRNARLYYGNRIWNTNHLQDAIQFLRRSQGECCFERQFLDRTQDWSFRRSSKKRVNETTCSVSTDSRQDSAPTTGAYGNCRDLEFSDHERYYEDGKVEWLRLPSREDLVAKYEATKDPHRRSLLRYAIDKGCKTRWMERFVYSQTEHGWHHLAVRSGCVKSLAEAFENLEVVVLPYTNVCNVSDRRDTLREPAWTRHRHMILVVKGDADGKKYREALGKIRMPEEYKMPEGSVPPGVRLYESDTIDHLAMLSSRIRNLRYPQATCRFQRSFEIQAIEPKRLVFSPFST